jgi:small subunit ribosomal protein S17
MPRKTNEEETIDAAPGADSANETAVEASETAPADAKPKRTRKAGTSTPATDDGGKGASGASTRKKSSKRAEKVGIVSSDKMTKTVVVRVDRLVKHPVYRKYVKRRKKFMAHDELGAKAGDKVKIVETRPLSARKRWRVVEIIQKAEL